MTNNKTHSLSGVQSNLLLAAAEGGRRIVSFETLAAESGVARARLRTIVSALIRRGWLAPLKRGLYMIVPIEAGPGRVSTEPSFAIAHHLMPDGAISHWSAMNYHELTDQIPSEVYVSGTRRATDRIISGVRYRFVAIPKRFFFGHQDAWVGAEKVRVTDLERTIVDALWMPEHCGGMHEVMRAMGGAAGKRIDFARLTAYLQKMDKAILFKRAGFVAELNGWQAPQIEIWRLHIDKNYNPLDPNGPVRGTINSGWRLRINMETGENR